MIMRRKSTRWHAQSVLSLACLGLIFLTYVILDFRRISKGHFGDFRHFYYASRALPEGMDLYRSGTQGYLYPPFIALFYVPVAGLPYAWAARVMLLINAAMGLAAVLLIAHEFAKRFDVSDIGRLVYVAALAGVLLDLDKVRSELQMFQTNTLMLLMFALSLRWLDRRPWLAGVPLGVIMNIKYLSLPIFPWLIIRRRYRSAAGMAAATVAFALLPAAVSGWRQNLHNLATAFGGLLHMLGIGGAVEQANVDPITSWFSISLTSAMARLTVLGPTMRMAAGYTALLLLIVLGVVVLIYRRENLPLLRWPSHEAQRRDQPWRAMIAVEFSSIVALTLCFSPQTNMRHLFLCLLLTIPAVLLIASPHGGISRISLAIAMILMMLGFILPPGDQIHTGRRWLVLWSGIGGPSWCLLIAPLSFLSAGANRRMDRKNVKAGLWKALENKEIFIENLNLPAASKSAG